MRPVVRLGNREINARRSRLRGMEDAYASPGISIRREARVGLDTGGRGCNRLIRGTPQDVMERLALPSDSGQRVADSCTVVAVTHGGFRRVIANRLEREDGAPAPKTKLCELERLVGLAG